MKKQTMRMIGVIITAVAMMGCGRNSEMPPPDPTPAEQARDAANRAGEATKDATGRALEKTGEALEDAGDAIQKSGENIQR